MTSQIILPQGPHASLQTLGWQGPITELEFEDNGMRQRLLALGNPLWAVSVNNRTALTISGGFSASSGDAALLAFAPTVLLE